MKTKSTTKRTLLASVLSLLLCLAMLIGSTFAWFTDSVTSGKNTIVAGNLKADLVHVGGGENGEDVSLKANPDHKIFDYDKWEPNYTAMETIKIVNDGSLAFKFRLDAASAGATAGPNGEKLADVIDLYVYEGTGDPADTASFADMTEENGWRLAGSLSSLMADPDGVSHGVLLPAGAEPKNGEPVGSVRMTIALHMQMSAGNEYQGLSLGDLSFTLGAAQYSFENDSFGPDYDKNAWNGEIDTAWFSDAAEDQTTFTLGSPAELAGLANLVKNGTDFSGKTITLNQNIDLDNRTWTPIGSKEDKIYFTGTFDGNGNTVSGLNLPDGDYVALFGAVKDAVVKNLTVSGSVGGENGAGIVARMESGVIENCVSMVNVSSTGKAGGIVCLTNASGCEITNCTNYGDVKGSAAGTTGGIGGIAAYVNANTVISGCSNYGTIGAEKDRYVGGIVGYCTGGSSTIANCSNIGNVVTGEGTTAVGGIVAISTGADTLTACTNSGAINGSARTIAGGVIGSTQSGKIENCVNTAAVNGQYAGGIVGVAGGAPEILFCSGGSAPITSPAMTLGFTGHSFQLQLNENDCAGRLIGANQGGGQHSWTKLTIDDSNGDDYQNIGAVGICGNTTTWSNLEIVSGTLHNDPVAGNRTYIKINENVNWNQREPGTYSCGGVVEASRKTEWTKQG